MSKESKKTVWIISELYYPEETGTGYYITRIAQGLADKYDVRVLCNQPSYSARGLNAPSNEFLNGVTITRCSTPPLNKDKFAFRFINFISISLSIFFQALFRIKKDDAVLVVTNPPLLPFLILVACRLRRAKCGLLVHDVYPEAMIAAGLLREQSVTTKLFRFLNALLYQNMDRIGVLGRDMADLVKKRLGNKLNGQVSLTRCWSDIEQIKPSTPTLNPLLNRLGLKDKFVVQYAGNIGRVQDIETLVNTMILLNNVDHDIHFLFIGSGAKRDWLKAEIMKENLTNCTLLQPMPRSEQQLFLNACDVSIIALVQSMTGVGVPSRMYNILASGKPVIAAVDKQSELAMVIKEEEVGWLVPIGQCDKLAETIVAAKNGDKLRYQMGARARNIAEERFSFQHVLPSYEGLVSSLSN